MHAEFIRTTRSSAIRADWPEGIEAPHPRAVEMADVMIDIAARGQGCSFKDLVREGFSSAEIVEHHGAAEACAKRRQVRQIDPHPDLIADIVAKARAPMPNCPPRPHRARQTQALLVRWRDYCAAHAALIIDPWAGQRERVVKRLSLALDQLPLGTAAHREVLARFETSLTKVGQ